MAHYCNSATEALFGVTVSGRQAAVPGIERIVGPTFATVPIRVSVDWEWSVTDFLQNVLDQATNMIPHEQFGLQRIRRIDADAERACEFQTLLVVQPANAEEVDELDALALLSSSDGNSRLAKTGPFSTYALTITVQPSHDAIDLTFDFDSAVLEPTWVQRLSTNFEHILQQLSVFDNMEQKLCNIVTPSDSDAQQMWRWNDKRPIVVNASVHDLISKTVREHPNTTAVDAWDGHLSYSELDKLSTSLAHVIRQHTAYTTSESVVPLCFGKSLWMPVAMLGVMKAGYASTVLDPNQPEARLRTIVRQVQPALILSSGPNQSLGRKLAAESAGPSVLVVDADLWHHHAQPGSEDKMQLPAVDPSRLLSVLFTSGSTGVPKGIEMSHQTSLAV